MTGPGLGSGALREAAKVFKTDVLGVGPWCVEFPDGEIVTTRSESRANAIAALSLSSPIEPQAESAYVRTCPLCGEWYNAKECDLCHVPTVATERTVRDRENGAAQASSEIREALENVLEIGCWEHQYDGSWRCRWCRMTKGDTPTNEPHDEYCDYMVARALLAPSRQGAGR